MKCNKIIASKVKLAQTIQDRIETKATVQNWLHNHIFSFFQLLICLYKAINL